MIIYILLLSNLGFLSALFFIFRRYIRHELGKVEYVQHVEKYLQQLLLDINRSAEDIAQVIEDRTQQLQDMFVQNEALLQEAKQSSEKFRQQKYPECLRELKQDAEETINNFQLRVLNLQEQWNKGEQELFLSLSAKLEGELRERAHLELQRELQQAVGALEKAAQDCEKYAQPGQAKSNNIRTQTLDARLRTEIEQYIGLGLDAQIISQKTGVPLNLVEFIEGIT